MTEPEYQQVVIHHECNDCLGCQQAILTRDIKPGVLVSICMINKTERDEICAELKGMKEDPNAETLTDKLKVDTLP